MKMFQSFNKESKISIILLGFLLVIFIGIADNLTGPEMDCSIFYVTAIFLITWTVGRQAGIAITIASTLAWTLANVMNAHTVPSSMLLTYWNIIMRLGFFLILTDILAALKNAIKHEQDLADLARTDYLTGVANGRYFFELGYTELNRACRNNYPFTVAYVDIDNFKDINDHFGHGIGDSLLYSVAQSIKKNIRAIDIVARLGGDEFAIFFPGTAFKPSEAVINRVHDALYSTMEKNGWPVTFSFGVVTFINIPDSVDFMIKEVDDLMYLVKSSGKDMIKHKLYKQE